MKKIYPPVRQYIQQTIKAFPWSYFEQGRVVAAISDHLIAGRKKSLSSYQRTGIEEFTVRKLSYALLIAEKHLDLLKESVCKEYNTIDRRQTFNISVDDTSVQRFGKKVFGASVHFDHARNGYEYGNVFVDFSVTARSYYDSGYRIYLAKSWLKKELITEDYHQTKIKLAKHIFLQQIEKLNRLGIVSKQIWCTIDSWFGCKEICESIEKKEANYVMGIKKNAICNLFGKEVPLEQVFATDKPWPFITSPYSQTKIYYQQKILNLKKIGRVKVFAIKRGQETRIRYYFTKHFKLTIQTFVKRWKDHWAVETLHDYLKHDFSLGKCYSGREIINQSYWNVVYFLNTTFQCYRREQKKKGRYYTIPQLIEAYCFDYDRERAKKHFGSKTRIEKAKRRLIAGWC